jgi:hypothetical protein
MVKRLRHNSTGNSLASLRSAKISNTCINWVFGIGEEVFAVLPMAVAESSRDQPFGQPPKQVPVSVSIEFLCLQIGNKQVLLLD